MSAETEGWIKWCEGDFIPSGLVQVELVNGEIVIRDAKKFSWNVLDVWKWRYAQEHNGMTPPADKPLGVAQDVAAASHAGTSSLQHQVGGRHYLDQKIQPVEYIEANSLGYLEGAVLKRITRHNHPHGKGSEDIEKAIHELQLLKELRYEK